MPTLQQRVQTWQVKRWADESEQERLAYLQKPIPPTPSEFLTPTKCRVLKSFCVAGKPLAVGDIVTIAAHVAQDMAHLGKAEILR